MKYRSSPPFPAAAAALGPSAAREQAWKSHPNSDIVAFKQTPEGQGTVVCNAMDMVAVIHHQLAGDFGSANPLTSIGVSFPGRSKQRKKPPD